MTSPRGDGMAEPSTGRAKMGGVATPTVKDYRDGDRSGQVGGRGFCVRLLEEMVEEKDEKNNIEAHEAATLREAIRRIKLETVRQFPDARKLDPTF